MRTQIAVLALSIGMGCISETSGIVADAPTAPTIAGHRVVWLDSGTLVSVALDGADRREQAVSECGGRPITNADAVYWTDCDHRLWRADLAGDNAALTGIELVELVAFSIDDVNAYSGADLLVRTPLDGSPPATLTTGGQIILATARSGDHVYFGAGGTFYDPEHGGLWRVDLDGGVATRLVRGILGRRRPSWGRMTSVLVVDDDAHIREVVRFALAKAGYVVELSTDGTSAFERLQRGGIDLVVLDVVMPELDGLALCRRLQGSVPIVVLSSRGEEVDRVLGLDLGADDYLAKPFSPRELVSRVAAVLRRVASHPTDRVSVPLPVLSIGTIAIDRDRHEVRVRDSVLQVTATELRLLATLASHRGRVLSRGQLIAAAYGDDHHISERTIDTHVRNLRSKLGCAGAIDVAIETVHGVGYRCG